MSRPNVEFIADLETIIRARLATGSDVSYTASLAAAGTKRIAQKIGEEGVELALAATAGDRQEVIDEAADLVYHLLVLLVDAGLSIEDVAIRLQARHND